MFFCLLLLLPFPALKKNVFLERLVKSGNTDCAFYYLMASHCAPMVFNIRIPSFIVAF